MTPILFTRIGFLHGFRKTIPLALGVATYGLVFGMLAQKTGLTVWQTVGMSLTVFAGAAQLVALDLWHNPLPVLAIIATTFVVNARHLLMGAALQPWLKTLTPMQAYGSLYFCADENWALSLREFRRGQKDAAFLFGGGFAIYLFWNLSTWIGFNGGLLIPDPKTLGLDFAFTAVFLSLLVGIWHGRQDTWPWGIAAVAAVIAHHFLPGKSYILIGAFAGSLAGVFSHGRE